MPDFRCVCLGHRPHTQIDLVQDSSRHCSPSFGAGVQLATKFGCASKPALDGFDQQSAHGIEVPQTTHTVQNGTCGRSQWDPIAKVR
ncbi:hypothetical protein UK23_38490 [Lentzea aerocolonigenes]|uniref:Uncharacterized protein n=1 Tax=Lentzea aerocolonigenes TaxID=68170 RepID=A0A0F0GJR1_LENAE|nr:hypothetical protein UK23_38490 [Lentzea aerocolonigenes]